MSKVLIVDDDVFICNILEKLLADNGYEVETAYSAASAKKLLKDSSFDVVLCDYRLPDSDGLKMLNSIKWLVPGAKVIIITAYADVSIAVKLIKGGADDYIVKPLRQDELLVLLRKLLQNSSGDRLPRKNGEEEFFFGESPEIKQLLQLAETVSPTDMSVIIDGETGSGKEYLARFIHYRSKRRERPFVALDCGAIPKSLANSELFGHIKGSFTGAVADKIGVFQEADGGTLFLDEIGNLDYEVQVKLLRTLQERKVNRVGDPKTTNIDVRIIAASNEDLSHLVEENKFREDLYHRINEFMMHLPPLRERRKDIQQYAEFFIQEANMQLDKDVTGMDADVMDLIRSYSWPGNLRELRNVIKRSVLLSQSDRITKDSLPREITSFHLHEEMNQSMGESSGELREVSRDAERKLIIGTLQSVDNNKSKAARILNVDRKTLYNKMKQLNIDLQSTTDSSEVR
ncbi:MAG: sigma-54 dependent transcriptional regulator [Bacteroidales bacterium]